MLTFEIFQGSFNEWFWRLKGGDTVLAYSARGFPSEFDTHRAIQEIQANASGASVAVYTVAAVPPFGTVQAPLVLSPLLRLPNASTNPQSVTEFIPAIPTLASSTQTCEEIPPGNLPSGTQEVVVRVVHEHIYVPVPDEPNSRSLRRSKSKRGK
jgi:uncharacterized protein YegP (UPF0339 family)